MSKKEKIHCIGIGGIGLNGVAQILHDKGIEVTGSDLEDSPIIEEMRQKGIKIYIGHNEKYITKDLNRVIYTSAIPQNNVELKKAKKLKIPLLTFSEAVKEVADDLYTVAVCGTHGKTTITAFCTLTMLAGDKDPTVIVGSKLKELNNSSYRTGKGKYFVVEACEYKRNFLNYSPDIIILSNIEADHMDYFKDLEDYKSAYKQFIAKLPEDGFLITNADDNNIKDVIKDFKGNLILFSEKDQKCDWFLKGNEVFKAGQKVCDIELAVPGQFNKLNALCGVILGQILNIDRQAILEKFKMYKGAWRRFEDIGNFMGMKIVSDYAHHPTAISKTLDAAREKFPDKKLCVIYQPHQYNRTKHFLNEFAESLGKADTIIIPNIYKVRDKKEDTESVSAEDLVNAISQKGGDVHFISDYPDIREFLIQQRAHIDVVFVMGAGDIWTLSEYLMKNSDSECTVCED